jgi:hypothetical protein
MAHTPGAKKKEIKHAPAVTGFPGGGGHPETERMPSLVVGDTE